MGTSLFSALAALLPFAVTQSLQESRFNGGTLVTLKHSAGTEVEQAVKSAHISGLDKVAALPSTNQLLLVGSEASLLQAKTLVAMNFDVAVLVKTFAVQHVDAQDLARQLIQQRPFPSGIKRVVADPAANRVIVQGTESGLRGVERRISELDRKG